MLGYVVVFAVLAVVAYIIRSRMAHPSTESSGVCARACSDTSANKNPNSVGHSCSKGAKECHLCQSKCHQYYSEVEQQKEKATECSSLKGRAGGKMHPPLSANFANKSGMCIDSTLCYTQGDGGAKLYQCKPWDMPVFKS